MPALTTGFATGGWLALPPIAKLRRIRGGRLAGVGRVLVEAYREVSHLRLKLGDDRFEVFERRLTLTVAGLQSLAAWTAWEGCAHALMESHSEPFESSPLNTYELVALHLVESPKLDHLITTYTGPKNPEVERIGWSDDTVWLDAVATKKGQPGTRGTIGFHGVPEAVWNFHIGGYHVCEKWLKDRKGRILSDEELAHYQKIVVALAETIRLMKEIDEVIESHGGWPGAFQGPATSAASDEGG